MDHFPLPSSPFEVWPLDFIQLPQISGYQNVLVMIFMFFHWVEAFPCRKATTQAVAKILLAPPPHQNYIVTGGLILQDKF